MTDRKEGLKRVGRTGSDSEGRLGGIKPGGVLPAWLAYTSLMFKVDGAKALG